jgi:hypothetical protein
VPVNEETPATQAVPLNEPPKAGKSVIGTAWPVSDFTVGEIVVTQEGTELSAADAKKVFAAAEAADVKLVTIKEVSE